MGFNADLERGPTKLKTISNSGIVIWNLVLSCCNKYGQKSIYIHLHVQLNLTESSLQVHVHSSVILVEKSYISFIHRMKLNAVWYIC